MTYWKGWDVLLWSALLVGATVTAYFILPAYFGIGLVLVLLSLVIWAALSRRIPPILRAVTELLLRFLRLPWWKSTIIVLGALILAAVSYFWWTRPVPPRAIVVGIADFDGLDDDRVYGFSELAFDSAVGKLDRENTACRNSIAPVIELRRIYEVIKKRERAQEIQEKEELDLLAWGWYRVPGEQSAIRVFVEVQESTSRVWSDFRDRQAQTRVPTSELKSMNFQDLLGEEIWMAIAVVLSERALATGRDECAAYFLGEAAVSFPPSRPSLLGWVARQRSALSLRHGDVSAAFNQAELARLAEPREIETWLAVGRASWASGQGQCAIRAFDRALRLDPGGVEAYWSKVVLLLELGLGAKAESLLSVETPVCSLPPDLALGLARALIESGHAKAGLEVIAGARREACIFPDLPETEVLGLLATHEARKALEKSLVVLKLRRSAPEIPRALVLASLAAGREKKQAIDLLQRDYHSPEIAWVGAVAAASILRSAGDPDSALLVIAWAEELLGSNSQAPYYTAVLLDSAGRPLEAVAEIASSLEATGYAASTSVFALLGKLCLDPGSLPPPTCERALANLQGFDLGVVAGALELHSAGKDEIGIALALRAAEGPLKALAHRTALAIGALQRFRRGEAQSGTLSELCLSPDQDNGWGLIRKVRADWFLSELAWLLGDCKYLNPMKTIDVSRFMPSDRECSEGDPLSWDLGPVNSEGHPSSRQVQLKP